MKNLLYIIPFALIFVSCTHTNNLNKHEIMGQRFLFDEKIDGQVGYVEIIPNENRLETKKDKGFEGILGTVLEVANAAGKFITMASIESKFENAANPKEVAQTVSHELEGQLIKYCNIQSTREIRDDYKFIATTKIERLALKSISGGIFLELQLYTEIIDRKSGETIWDNRETNSSSLKYVNFDPSNKSKLSREASNSMQLIDLVTISEENLRNSVNNAAREIANDMTETLLEDLKPMLSKK